MMRSYFEVDKAEAKLMGVCSGLARMTGVDATIIRIGFVLATLLGGWPWTLIAYVILGVVGKPKHGRIHRSAARRESVGQAGEHAGAMTDLDRRLAEVDHYVASSNGRLAREIEELR